MGFTVVTCMRGPMDLSFPYKIAQFESSGAAMCSDALYIMIGCATTVHDGLVGASSATRKIHGAVLALHNECSPPKVFHETSSTVSRSCAKDHLVWPDSPSNLGMGLQRLVCRFVLDIMMHRARIVRHFQTDSLLPIGPTYGLIFVGVFCFAVFDARPSEDSETRC